MNKKVIFITMLSIITGLVLLNITNKEDRAKELKNNFQNTNMLTMMLETEAGTGNYEEVTQSEWLQEGYEFNASLSRCENGSKLTWDKDFKKVILTANVSDKCYAYFDKISLINFTIDSIQYSAEKDMTWEEWIDSKYNTGNYGQHCSSTAVTPNGGGASDDAIAYSDGDRVDVLDIILENYDYIPWDSSLEPCK